MAHQLEESLMRVQLQSLFIIAACAWAANAGAQESLVDAYDYGIPLSQYGTYIHQGEWLLSPSFAYSDDDRFEYASREFGFSPGLHEEKGKYQASKVAVLAAYGFSDRLALELGAAAVDASLKRAPDDPSNFPPKLSQSGLADVKARVNWRWLTESGRRPEIVPYAQIRVPQSKRDVLLGTSGWLFNVGLGASRDFDWGRMTIRAGVEYDLSSSSVGDWGETAIEYYKRLSPRFSAFGSLIMLQGDEGSFIAQLQWHVSPDFTVQLSNGIGLTTQAINWQPQIGVVVRFPAR